jgi:hypothetical protein
VVPVNAVPLTTTDVAALPEVGLNEEILGTTPNAVGLVLLPAGVVTVMGPLKAPEGTVAVILESETTVNAAVTPLKVTLVAPLKPLPLIATDDPTVADVGETLEMLGAG